MKISQMLNREDFYSINKKTLDAYFGKQAGTTTFYVYPKLNAIVTKTPSKAVREYLLNEYTIRGNFIKKLLVQGYVKLCLLSRGLLAAQKVEVLSDCSNHLLIYPCNKKYRIFDFSDNTVEVIIKDGFDDRDLVREKAFRTKEDVPAFVPGVISVSAMGYKEEIIDGLPLARISDGFLKYRDAAYDLMKNYGKQFEKVMPAEEYVKQLVDKIEAEAGEKVKDKATLKTICKNLADMAVKENIVLCFSHGDFQAGNIWIENKTEKIYIIDWESCDLRSKWYDEAVLLHSLRPEGVTSYLASDVPNQQKAVVLLEDIIFQLNELNSLPLDFGEQNFKAYLEALVHWEILGVKE